MQNIADIFENLHFFFHYTFNNVLIWKGNFRLLLPLVPFCDRKWGYFVVYMKVRFLDIVSMNLYKHILFRNQPMHINYVI
jgi:hypothetical protein